MTPTHVLKVLNKKTDARSVCGVGWLNKDGSISIQLNPCIIMKQESNLVFTLFTKLPAKGTNESTTCS